MHDGIPFFNEMPVCMMYTYLNGRHLEIIGGFYYQVVTGPTMIICCIDFSDFWRKTGIGDRPVKSCPAWLCFSGVGRFDIRIFYCCFCILNVFGKTFFYCYLFF